MIAGLRIAEDDLSGEAIAALLRFHLDEMYRWSPPESVHAMPIDRLRETDVTFWSAWARTGEGERLAGCGALKKLGPRHGEIKSMRSAPAYRGRGVGRAILHHLIAEARARGYARVSLETGASEPYVPARTLYDAEGFTRCAPFGDYRPDPNSVFMTLAL